MERDGNSDMPARAAPRSFADAIATAHLILDFITRALDAPGAARKAPLWHA